MISAKNFSFLLLLTEWTRFVVAGDSVRNLVVGGDDAGPDAFPYHGMSRYLRISLLLVVEWNKWIQIFSTKAVDALTPSLLIVCHSPASPNSSQ